MSVQCATALAGRIAGMFGEPLAAANNLTHVFPSPEILAEADLTKAGVIKSRAATICALARAVCGGLINFEGIVDSESFLTKLCEISGIGKWTAQYVAMRALGEPDAFPVGDVGLLRALDIKGSQELEQRSEAWRPWRAYATIYLWNHDSERSVRGSKSLRARTQKTPAETRGLRHHVSRSV